ncbi:hypothetical protein PAXRUDRAFT_179970, partial [Paxillus rubicundulus Ve08.2h10]
LAWFWTMDDVQRDAEANNWMSKCMFLSICGPSWKELKLSCTSVYRGHWLRAKALKDRWEVEVELLRAEGKWTINFFDYKARSWDKLFQAS